MNARANPKTANRPAKVAPPLPLRGDCYNSSCIAREIVDHVFSRWGGLVLGALARGTMRYSELRTTIDGISEKMLAQTLRTLERDGLIDRRSYGVVPPRVEYTLTPLGRECAERIEALVDWIDERSPLIHLARDAYDNR